MSLALSAVLLIRLDARLDEWQSVEVLASHCAVTRAQVVAELEALASSSMIRAQRDDAGEIVGAMCPRPA